jgi:predicted anti-sigma-YlaC factor YlaD
MNCKEVIEFLADYLDRTLPWRQRLVFLLHLAVCRHCRRYLASYADTIRLASVLGRESLADVPPAPAELIQAILAARRLEEGRAKGRVTDGGTEHPN